MEPFQRFSSLVVHVAILCVRCGHDREVVFALETVTTIAHAVQSKLFSYFRKSTFECALQLTWSSVHIARSFTHREHFVLMEGRFEIYRLTCQNLLIFGRHALSPSLHALRKY